MRRLLVAVALLVPAVVFGVATTRMDSVRYWFPWEVRTGPILCTQLELSTNLVEDGTQTYCADCLPGSDPCACAPQDALQKGAFAWREEGRWRCGFGGGGGGFQCSDLDACPTTDCFNCPDIGGAGAECNICPIVASCPMSGAGGSCNSNSCDRQVIWNDEGVCTGDPEFSWQDRGMGTREAVVGDPDMAVCGAVGVAATMFRNDGSVRNNGPLAQWSNQFDFVPPSIRQNPGLGNGMVSIRAYDQCKNIDGPYSLSATHGAVFEFEYGHPFGGVVGDPESGQALGFPKFTMCGTETDGVPGASAGDCAVLGWMDNVDRAVPPTTAGTPWSLLGSPGPVLNSEPTSIAFPSMALGKGTFGRSWCATANGFTCKANAGAPGWTGAFQLWGRGRGQTTKNWSTSGAELPPALCDQYSIGTFYYDIDVSALCYCNGERWVNGTTGVPYNANDCGTQAVFNGGVSGGVIPTLPNNDVTPTVRGVSVAFVANTGATTITAFDDGYAGQQLTLLFTNTNTTLSDAGTLALTGAFTSTANDSVVLLFDGTNWIELSRSVN